MKASTPLLRLEHLGKTFRLHTLGQKTIQALADVSFAVLPGEFLALTGPSGAGKSTILKCIYRTYLASQGRIWYDSREFGPLDLAQVSSQTILRLRQREIGYVAQFLKVIPRVTTVDIVAEPLWRQNGLDLNAARQQAADLLLRLQLSRALLEAYPATCSGGEQQRVNIARAVIWRPRLLLMDEPTASLDPRAVAEVCQLFRELKETGTTIVAILHHLEPLAPLLDRVLEVPAPEVHHVP